MKQNIKKDYLFDIKSTILKEEICVSIEIAKKHFKNKLTKFEKYYNEVHEITFPKRKKTTIGVYRIVVYDMPTNISFSMIAKGIRKEENEDFLSEDKILSEPSFNTHRNSLNPPKVYHISDYKDSVWIFMEYISEIKDLSLWSERDFVKIAIAIGSFNSYFSGKRISKIRWVKNHNLKHIALNTFEPGLHLLKALHNAGKRGHFAAYKAKLSLEIFLKNFSKWIQFISSQPLVLSHRDLGPDENIFIQLKNNTPRAIDWQNCGLSPVGYDPAWAIWKLQKNGEDKSLFCEKKFLYQYINGLKIHGINICSKNIILSVAICYATIIIKRHIFTLQWEFTANEGFPRDSFVYAYHNTIVHPLNTLQKLTKATENFTKKLEMINIHKI